MLDKFNKLNKGIIHMKHKIVKIATLSLIAACFTGASFADDAETCQQQQALVKAELDKLHAQNKFNELVYETPKVKSGCFAGFIAKVETEKEMSEIHARFISHLNTAFGYKFSNAKYYSKI